MKYHNHKIMMFICATAFSVTACSNSNSFSDPIDFETPSEAPNPYTYTRNCQDFYHNSRWHIFLGRGRSQTF